MSFGWIIPRACSKATGSSAWAARVAETSGIFNLPAFCIICLIGVLLYRGTRESALFNTSSSPSKVLVVLFFIAFGFGHVGHCQLSSRGGTQTGCRLLPVRHRRHARWRGVYLLCLHRLRCSFDGCRRGEEPRSATCLSALSAASRFARFCTSSLWRFSPAWCRSYAFERPIAGRVCDGSRSDGLGQRDHLAWRDRRTDDRAACHDVRANACLLRDVARRIASTDLHQGASEFGARPVFRDSSSRSSSRPTGAFTPIGIVGASTNMGTLFAFILVRSRSRSAQATSGTRRKIHYAPRPVLPTDSFVSLRARADLLPQSRQSDVFGIPLSGSRSQSG